VDQDPLAPLLPDDRLTGDVSAPPPPDASDPFAPPEPSPAVPGAVAETRASWMLGDAATSPPSPVAAAPMLPTIDPYQVSPSNAAGPRKGIAAAAAALAALFGVFAVKVIIGFLVAGAATSAIGAVFGGPWDHLPSVTKGRLNQRVEAALGQGAKGLSDSDKSAKLYAMSLAGLARLSDQTLIRRVELYKLALDTTDEATCAAILRSSMKGLVADADKKKLIGSLTTDQFSEWAEIGVQALEAEAKGAPPARKVSTADSNAMYYAILAAVSGQDVATIKALSGGTTVTDTAACHANRSVYAAGLALDDAKRAAFALTDVAP